MELEELIKLYTNLYDKEHILFHQELIAFYKYFYNIDLCLSTVKGRQFVSFVKNYHKDYTIATRKNYHWKIKKVKYYNML